MLRRHASFLTMGLIAFSAHIATAQRPRTTATVSLDSTEIKRLPLVRGEEIPSFLSGAVSALGYGSSLIGAAGGSDVRIDGVPAKNIVLSAGAISSVEAYLFGTTPRYPEPDMLTFSTRHAGQRGGYARLTSDKLMPGSIGLARAEAGARMPLGSRLHFSGDVTALSALHTEFNNYGGDVPIYLAAGIDTAITYDPNYGSNDTRTVPIPGFTKSDGDVPVSNWNQLLANARLDLIQSTRSSFFVAGYFTRNQQREPFGNGGCSACQLYNIAAQHGQRMDASLVTLGIEHQFSGAMLHVRLARMGTQQISGVLAPAFAASLQAKSYGLDVAPYKMLVDNETFAVTTDLVRKVLENQQSGTLYPSNRTDLNTSVEWRLNPYAVFSTFTTRGVASGTYQYGSDNRLYAAATIETDAGANHLLFGGKATSYDVSYVNAGYTGPPLITVWTERPVALSGWLNDDLVLGKAFFEFGVRVDNYDSKADFPVVPGYYVLNDPTTFKKASSKTKVSPRASFTLPLQRASIRATIGRYARIASFNEQFDGKNADFFRFRNSSLNTGFNDGAIGLIDLTAASVDAQVHVSDKAEISISPFFNRLNNMTQYAAVPVSDPTNPGGTSYLTVARPFGKRDETGGIVSARFKASESWVATGSVAHTRYKNSTSGTMILLNAKTSLTSLNGLLEHHSRALGEFNTTIALRALAPVDYFEKKTAWLLRTDARVSKALNLRGVHGEIWIDGLRLLGSSEYVSGFDESAIVTQVMNDRYTLGAGTVSPDVNLTSMSTAGPGVRNEADLYLLRKAEERFGNGDAHFTAEEQTAAFTAAAKLTATAAKQLSQSRRIQFGVAVHF